MLFTLSLCWGSTARGAAVSRRPVISHIGVAVNDLAAALAFYRDVLGLEPSPPETADGATIV
jgi:catechol-2,3-dioxygenase